jgi:MSHA biogenesis protein MshP
VSRSAARPRRCAGRQAGFSLVAVIFLIVVLAALGAFAVQIAMTQYQSSTLELLEARAQAAAEAGIEYGANLTLQAAPAICASTPSSNTFTLTQGALTGFVVTLTCTPTQHQIWSTTTSTWQPYTDFALAATASHGTYGEQDYVSRSVTRNVTLAPP